VGVAVFMVLTAAPVLAQRAKDLPNLSTLSSNSLMITTVNDTGGGSRHTSFGQLSNQLFTAFSANANFHAAFATNAINATNLYGNAATATLATNAINATNLYGNAATATLATQALNLSIALTNWHLATVPDYGGDVTNLTSSGTTPDSNYVFYAFAGGTNFTIMGGKFSSVLTGPGNVFYAPTNEQSGIAGPGIAKASLVTINFGIDSQEFIASMAGGGQRCDFTVDGVDVLRSVPLSYAQNFVRLQFSTLKQRTIQILNPEYFNGVYVPVTNALWKTKRPTHKLMIIGDSYIQQTPGYYVNLLRSICSTVQAGLPDWEVLGYGESGTGWFYPGSGGYTNYLGRLPDIQREQPDALIFFGGYNDQSFTTNTSQTNIVFQYATNVLLQTRAAFPAMPIFVIGPEVGNELAGTVPEYAYCETLLEQASALTTNVTFASPRRERWITGYAPTANSGNANRYSYVDNIHLNTEGHAFFGEKILSIIKPILLNNEDVPGYYKTNVWTARNDFTDRVRFRMGALNNGDLIVGAQAGSPGVAGNNIIWGMNLQQANGNETAYRKVMSLQDYSPSSFFKLFIGGDVQAIGYPGPTVIGFGLSSTYAGATAIRANMTATDFSPNASGGMTLGTVQPWGTITTTNIVSTLKTPTSASAAGTAGTIVWDANYIYICTAANTWKRVAIATW